VDEASPGPVDSDSMPEGEAQSPSPSLRQPWLAGLLGFVVPGLGHLYAGRIGQAVLAFVALAVLGVAMLVSMVALPGPPANVVVPLALIMAFRVLVAVDSARAARAFPQGRPIPRFSRWYWCLAAGVLVGLVLNPLWTVVVRTTFVEAYQIPTGAMEPTILRGDHLLATKWAYGWRLPILGNVAVGARAPARGDLVLFRFPADRSRVFIKRVIGLPHETVEIRAKSVLVNGSRLREPYARFLEPPMEGPLGAETTRARDDWGPQTVPAGAYFVLGDNRDNSRDSRYWGFLPGSDVLGRAAMVYWSLEPQGGGIRWDRIGHRLE
jgi:signal peptidase I